MAKTPPPNDLLKHVWLPYTQMQTARQPLQAVSTQGSLIQLADGRELIDGIASLVDRLPRLQPPAYPGGDGGPAGKNAACDVRRPCP